MLNRTIDDLAAPRGAGTWTLYDATCPGSATYRAIARLVGGALFARALTWVLPGRRARERAS